MVAVLQISDTHLRAEPHRPAARDPDAALDASLAAAAQLRPDLVLLTGDLADDGSVAALQRLRAAVQQFAAPVLALAGNHDRPDSVSDVFGQTDCVELGAWRVLAVETMMPRRIHGRVDVDQLAARLDSLDDRPTVLAMHHPPRSPSTHRWFRLTAADALLAALRQRPHVRAIVSGHLHELFRYQLDGGAELCGAPSTYYAIQHHGDGYEIDADGVVGTQLIELGDDGSFACQPVPRSLGC